MDLGESVSTDKEKFKKYTVNFFFFFTSRCKSVCIRRSHFGLEKDLILDCEYKFLEVPRNVVISGLWV